MFSNFKRNATKMPLIEVETVIKADIKTCFDLARNIDVHQASLNYSGEKAIAGKMSGLIGLGEWVSWEAKHLGFVQYLTAADKTHQRECQ